VAGDYEKTLISEQHFDTPRPKIVSMNLKVDLYPHHPRGDDARLLCRREPHRRAAEGHPPAVRPRPEGEGRFDEGGRPAAKPYKRFNYRIFALDTPMLPGERRVITFTTERAQRGFRNSGNETRVVDNGTFINNNEIAPLLGVERSGCFRTGPSAASTACRRNCARRSWATRPAGRSTTCAMTPTLCGRHHRHDGRRPDADRARLRSVQRDRKAVAARHGS
jgi:hypothetical protein